MEYVYVRLSLCVCERALREYVFHISVIPSSIIRSFSLHFSHIFQYRNIFLCLSVNRSPVPYRLASLNDLCDVREIVVAVHKHFDVFECNESREIAIVYALQCYIFILSVCVHVRICV